MVEEFKGRFGWSVSKVVEINEVIDKYRGMLRITGKGAVSSDDLAREMGLKRFAESNYREGLLRLTGETREEVRGFEAHHVFPQKFEQKFSYAGLENIHDARLLAWVDEIEHKSWSNAYNEAWDTFFKENQDAKIDEILEEGMRLAEEFGYDVLYEMPGNWLTEWFQLFTR